MRIQSDGTADGGRPFHKIWDFHNKRFSRPIRWYLLAGAAVVTGAAGIAAGMGLIGLPHLAVMGMVAALDLGIRGVRERRMINEARESLEELPDADEKVQDLTEALFKRAGLNYKPVIKQQGSSMSLSEAFNAAVIPVPTGPKKDEIMVFVGEGLQLSLTDEEMASVLAHETSHITNTPPAQKLFARVTHSANRALLITGIATLNPIVCALSMGASILRCYFNNAAQKYDEDRADMNGIALFPHESAAEDSLGQIYRVGETLQRINATDKPPGFLKKATQKVFEFVFSDHREKDERLPMLKEFHKAVDRFYEENGLDVEQAQDEVLNGPSSFRFG